MGCDIHLYVEKKKNGVWELEWAKDTITVEDFDGFTNKSKEFLAAYPGQIIPDEQFTPKWEAKRKHPFYLDRNYFLFALLSNVRNSFGVEPLAQPKGCPEDASEGYAWYYEFWKGDRHSSSYFTLSELLAFNWNSTVREEGYLNPWGHYTLKTKGEPDLYFKEPPGTRTEVTLESMDYFVSRVTHDLGPKASESQMLKAFHTFPHVCKASWNVQVSWNAGSFLTATIPALQKLASDASTDDVRICFFFDN